MYYKRYSKGCLPQDWLMKKEDKKTDIQMVLEKLLSMEQSKFDRLIEHHASGEIAELIRESGAHYVL